MDNDDAETRRQIKEATEMHRALALSPLGGVLSTFMAQAAVYRSTLGGEVAYNTVLSIARALVGVLSSERARTRTNMKNAHGKLPRCIFVADILGRRFAFHCESPVLIREVCASFYGQSECSYGHASYLRRSIEAQIAGIVAAGASCALVLVVPWGKALEDRAWRLFSIEELFDVDTGALVGVRDSESVLTNFQTPPTPPGSSVNGRAGECCFPSADVVAAFCETYKAIDLDAKVDVPSKPSSDKSEESRVLRQLLEKLRSDNVVLEQRARAAESAKSRSDADSARFLNEKAALYAEIETLHATIEAQCVHVNMERVASDALKREVALAEAQLLECGERARERACERERVVQTLRGDLLVMEEIKSKMASKDKEIQHAHAALKESRKKDGESAAKAARAAAAAKAQREELEAKLDELKQQLDANRKRADSEANELEERLRRAQRDAATKTALLESIQNDRDALLGKVEQMKKTTQHVKQTSSETISRLVDTAQKHETRCKELGERGKAVALDAVARALLARAARARAARLAARVFALKLILRRSLAAPMKQEEIDEATATTDAAAASAAPSARPCGGGYYPADEVAAVARCISVLQDFKDRVTSGSFAAPRAPRSPTFNEHELYTSFHHHQYQSQNHQNHHNQHHTHQNQYAPTPRPHGPPRFRTRSDFFYGQNEFATR